MEEQYFCAQTLRTKVQRDFDELPPGAAEGLRDSLVSLLLRFSRGAPPVRTQLCLALASLPPHVPMHGWGEGGVVQWLVQRLTQVVSPSSMQNNPTCCLVLRVCFCLVQPPSRAHS